MSQSTIFYWFNIGCAMSNITLLVVPTAMLNKALEHECFNRFSEVTELKLVWWLEVKGMIDIRILSYNTNYAAYLVFKLRNKRTIEFRQRAVGLHINVGGITSWEVRRVSLDPSQNGTQHVREREDGWMEVEMGELFNEFGDDGTVQLSLREIDTSYYKQGLIIEGIELRPKDTGS
ncbi:hypothetical protein Goshw_023757 [Gossypium schwendimanii]|uniref:Uncharacterized protein n=1 Tax=Gossypium schwendimanii TaxID=34291 RepID=A0A7J9LIA4_GOSSC|nr:hypothetical protein [Gossypium schwendimanii]